jgi:hypothetical protein
MREDIKKIIESRLSWRLFKDKQYQDLNEARRIASTENDSLSVDILDDMIAKRQEEVTKGC